jgi:uncharacterized protein (DUF2249 family)
MAGTVVREAHQRLRGRLGALLAAEDSDPQAADELVDFCLHEVRTYLAVADEQVCGPAYDIPGGRLLVEALRAGASALDARIDSLAGAEPLDRRGIGRTIAALLDLQLTVEESVLLPALEGISGVASAGLHDFLLKEWIETSVVIDVRRIARGGRHPRVFARYGRLAPGEAFILVHNHDPQPLRREFEAIYPGSFTWDYLVAGPDEWRVRIGRVAQDA